MAKKGRIATFVIVLVVAFVVGFFGGAVGYTYIDFVSNPDHIPDSIVLEGKNTSGTFYDPNADEYNAATRSLADDISPSAPAPSTPSEGNQSSLGNVTVDEAGISIHFIELGNKYTGDCTYIKVGEVDILIDCGSKSTSVPYVKNYLNHYITGALDYVIVTHAHEDHYAGFATSKFEDSIFAYFECKNIITFSQTNQKDTSTKYKNFKRNVAQEESDGAKVYTAQDCIDLMPSGAPNASYNNNIYGYAFNLSNAVTMTILNSVYYKERKATTENDYSVCTLFTYNEGEHSHNYLFTGDLEKEGEDWLANPDNKVNIPQCDLYKAGHHGSKTSSNDNLMRVVKPKVICVCCCAGSSEYTKTINNQFPTQEFINRVAQYTADIFVTSLCVDYKNNEFESFNGNIIYIAKDDEYNMMFSNNSIRFKDSEWFNREITENGTTRRMRTWPQNGKT